MTPGVLDLPLTGGWAERRAIWQPVRSPEYDAILVVVERGPGPGAARAGRRERVRSYRCVFDAQSATWLVLPSHSEDGEIYALTPYSCSCRAARCRRACAHRQAFESLYAAGLI